LQDVLVGEVWMCSGQSNMAWSLGQTYTGDLEGAASRHPLIRLISVPQVGTQELQNGLQGCKWEAATPESVKGFSAVGFLYGRYLHEILGVPVGLIDNAWGGSAAEAWVRRTTIDRDPRFKGLMESTASGSCACNHRKAKRTSTPPWPNGKPRPPPPRPPKRHRRPARSNG
jgi:sialate O-acetylesterase